MRYMVLLYGDETVWERATAEERTATYDRHRQFAEAVAELGGRIAGGGELEPTATATSIRGDLITDGPFIEAKEALGGFYIIEARDLDHMLAMAKHCPASTGGVEIRPIVDHSAA